MDETAAWARGRLAIKDIQSGTQCLPAFSCCLSLILLLLRLGFDVYGLGAIRLCGGAGWATRLDAPRHGMTLYCIHGMACGRAAGGKEHE